MNRNEAGIKVKQIIEQEFDGRIAMSVVTYILHHGFDKLKEITEDDILEIKGNAFMADKFCQALVRCAVRICKECKEIDDFLPFIVNHLYVPKANMHKVTFYQDEMTEYRWASFINILDIDYEENADEIQMVTLNANVIETA